MIYSHVSADCQSKGKRRSSVVGKMYPFDKFHNDRVHGTFHVMMNFGGGGPVVRVVFDGGLCLGSHDKVVEVDTTEADTVSLNEMKQRLL